MSIIIGVAVIGGYAVALKCFTARQNKLLKM